MARRISHISWYLLEWRWQALVLRYQELSATKRARGSEGCSTVQPFSSNTDDDNDVLPALITDSESSSDSELSSDSDDDPDDSDGTVCVPIPRSFRPIFMDTPVLEFGTWPTDPLKFKQAMCIMYLLRKHHMHASLATWRIAALVHQLRLAHNHPARAGGTSSVPLRRSHYPDADLPAAFHHVPIANATEVGYFHGRDVDISLHGANSDVDPVSIVSSTVTVSAQPCVSPSRPCDAYGGFPGGHCCRTCSRGSPCAARYHTHDSSRLEGPATSSGHRNPPRQIPDFEKNQLFYLRPDLPHSWLFPAHS